MDPQYDVFLSYNSKDRPSVEHVAGKLGEYGIRVWFDVDEIMPGTSVLRNIDQAMRSSRSVAVFISDFSLGPWQTPEVEAAIQSQLRHGIRVIPVFLPSISEEVRLALPSFLLNERYIDFSRGLDNDNEFYNLRWGITGVKPERKKSVDSTVDESDQDTFQPSLADEAIGDLVEILKSQNVTFFLGPGASFGSTPSPAQASDIARDLLTELKIIQADYRELLPPVDVAGLYYGIRSGDRILEKKVVGRTAQGSKVFPQTHDLLAKLLKLLSTRPPRRTGSGSPQLVVTTNLDLMAERALLRAGLSFTRIVQYRSGQRIDVSEYRQVQLIGDQTIQLANQLGDLQQARMDNFDEIDHLIANCGRDAMAADRAGRGDTSGVVKFSNLTQPILYKFLGSQDVEGSCVISTLHHFEFARNVIQFKALPEELTSTIRNSTILFLGLWFMDPDFRLTYFTLLRDALQMENDRRYAVQLPPKRFAQDAYRRMEWGIWDKIKEAGIRQMSITAIEEPCDEFLRRLYERAMIELRLKP